MDNFNLCLNVTLRFEGGFSNKGYNRKGGFDMDKADLGGRTQWGVTQAIYDRYRTTCHEPTQSVSLVTQAEAGDLYRRFYYDPCRCDQMSPDWAVLMFDTAVLCGRGRAIAWLNEAVGAPASAIIAPATFAAMNALAPTDTIQAERDFLLLRDQHHRQFVDAHPEQGKWLNGWINRVDDLRQAVLSGGFLA